ncbi:hypothetical protein MHUMG1_08934 [Metarhizium humberi]|uniref:Ankyrin repeat-containing domain protein n=1 Tax=Metarhizium humberi TaxID=2596975 RepID=A0A9P8M3R0_9HYPO|nr:hypothetical protein MHUMG1_08934 [Metarhizium humberi]
MMALARPRLDNSEYTVGWIAALPHERTAARAMLDETHASPQYRHEKDDNIYVLGSVRCEIGQHYVVIAGLPSGQCGNTAATTAAAQMLSTFPAIKFGLMVGIGGGIWSEKNDIRLGDVVVSNPDGSSGGVKQYDSGKSTVDGFQHSGWLKPPPRVLLNAINDLQSKHGMERSMIPDILRDMHRKHPLMQQSRTGPGFVHQGTSNDRLFRSDYHHQRKDENCHACDKTGEIARKERPDCDPFIHYGTIASGDKIIKDPQTRDHLAQDCLCFETEAAGLMNDFPCLVIRGISDYCDSHKNDEWQKYAAATAAAYAKELLLIIDPAAVNKATRARDGQDEQDRRDILNWITPVDYGPQCSDILKRRSEGTGQWLLDSIEFQNWLKKSIQESGLDAAYKKTIETIENQDQNSVSLAKRTLAWTVYAERSFSVEELRHVLATRPDWLQDMQADLAETCLTYLLYDCFRVGSCRADQAFEAEFNFYEYAAAKWGHHAGIGRSSKASLPRKEKIQLLLDEFLATDPLPPSFLYWLFRLKERIMHVIDNFAPEDSHWRISSLFESPLNWLSIPSWSTSYRRNKRFRWSYDKMTFVVLQALITASLERARLVLAPCPHPEHWHNLSSSAFEDHPPLCLDDGALGCKKSCTPEAVENLKGWNEKIFELLFQAVDKDVLTKKAKRQKSLPEESRDMFSRDTFSHVSSLTTDPHVETRDFAEWLPFFENHDAPQRCLEEIANLTAILLLKAKAGFKEWTEEEEELFRRLLLKPRPNIAVNMEIKFGLYGTALIAACAKGNIDALHLLLQQPNVEVAITTEFGEYGTAFIAACANGRMDALHLLLQQPNVEVNMATQFGYYGTALIAACSNTRVVLDENETMATTVKYLLEKGAHVNHSTVGEARAKYLTALAAAVHGGIPRIVQILLNSGAIADERVKNDMPSDSWTARRRWDCLRFQVSRPNTEGTELVRTCMDKEWIDQCTLAAQQLSMAIIYSLLEVDASWADEYIPQALYYLRAFSSRWMESLDRFAAAQITLQQFGFGGKDLDGKMLLFLQNELRVDDQEWNQVVAYFKELILEFEEGRIPPLRQTQTDDFDPHFDMLPYSDISDEILSEPEEGRIPTPRRTGTDNFDSDIDMLSL